MKSIKSIFFNVLLPMFIILCFIGGIIFVFVSTCDNLVEAEEADERYRQEQIADIVANAYNGIDVSHHNGNLDWTTIGSNQCKATEGANYVDKQYQNNRKNASKNKILVGAYHYFNSKPAKFQFKNFSSIVKKSEIDLIPVIDVEAFGLKAYNGNWKEIRKNLLSLASMMKKHYGHQPILYLNHDTYTMLGNLDDFNIWLMPLKNNNKVPKNTIMYQLDGAKKINGVDTDINWVDDINDIIL